MPDTPLLSVEKLAVSFRQNQGEDVEAVTEVSFSLHKGEILALVGESGSGKSVSALSILRLLPYPATYHPSGEILLEGNDLLQVKERGLRQIRGKRISMIFQEPMTSLNPLHTVGKQIAEAITIHQPLGGGALKKRIKELLEMVGLKKLTSRLNAYPHELSGGQRQRVMIAMALANNPDILIADEPTTALDVTVQAQILQLLKKLRKELGMAVLLITHDLTIVRNMADRIAVMQRGTIVEQGKVADIFAQPEHPYTRSLLTAEPGGEPVPTPEDTRTLLTSPRLKVWFPKKKRWYGGVESYIKAVNNVHLSLKEGYTLGIVGESGSGKTTLALALLRLIRSRGSIIFNHREIQGLRAKDLRSLRQQMQIVFQDPYSSLNPRLTISEIIEEGLLAHGIGKNKAARDALIDDVLQDVGLDATIKYRYPHEFSGGQRQRISIARALVLHPKLIVLDEPTSALDLSTQAEIIALLKNLQQHQKLSYIFISHDLRVVKAISHDIIVMRDGKLVEYGSNDEIFDSPQDKYTKQLISAAFEAV